MNVNRYQIEDETDDLPKLMNHSVGSFSEGVTLMCVAMVENARDAARRGDNDAKRFLSEWQEFFADRHHN